MLKNSFLGFGKSAAVRIVTLVSIIVIIVLLNQILLLSRSHEKLQRSHSNLQQAVSELQKDVPGNLEMQRRLDTLENRVDDLESRLYHQEQRRLLDIPEGANDFGAAMEGTIQWNALLARIHDISTNVDSRLGAIEVADRDRDSRMNLLDARIVNTHRSVYSSSVSDNEVLILDLERHLIGSGLSLGATLSYNTELEQFGGEWILPVGSLELDRIQYEDASPVEVVWVWLPAGEFVTLKSPWGYDGEFTFEVDAFMHYQNYLGAVEVCKFSANAFFSSCQNVWSYDTRFLDSDGR